MSGKGQVGVGRRPELIGTLSPGSDGSPNGEYIVGTVNTSATQGATPATWQAVSYSTAFASTPVVLSQVQTNNDTQWVKTRQTGVSTSGFSVALEEDEVQTAPHGQETIGWLAITAGSGTWSGHTYVAAQSARAINGNWIPTSFSGVSFTAAPRFVASLATTNNGDSAHVRYQMLTASGVQVTAEEDTTQDGETGHTPEEVAYLAIEGDGTLTVSTGSSVEVTKYYYLGGQRVTMRVGSTVYFLHGDHLGSASLTTDASGGVESEMRYYAYGATRSGSVPTDRRYTGQREDTYTQLYHMGARWYDAELARWTSSDSIVPDPGNPQALNRYTYNLANPLGYVDPDGRNPLPFALVLAGSYIVGRGTYEAMTVLFPTLDRSRRDQIGGSLVTNVSDAITREASAHSIDPTLLGAVLRHESAAVERRLLTAWPTMQPGVMANGAEWIQSTLKGDAASIGPGQMQLRRALELEEMGHVRSRSGEAATRAALLGGETSAEYVAGMLHYVSDQLNALEGFSSLNSEMQKRLTLIGYNWGWTDDFTGMLGKLGFEGMVRASGYDDQTLDEYLRWLSEQ